ncbi:MAG: hypothetical protein ACP5NW_02165 [Candidatus Woesearchaeota archaeon]
MRKTVNLRCSDAELVRIYDNQEDSNLGKIELEISQDDKLYFENHYGIVQESLPCNNFELIIEGYYGKIFLPKHCALEIQSERDITGKIGSPAVIINGKGNLDIDIERDRLLDVSLITYGSLVLNQKKHPEIAGKYYYINPNKKKIEELREKYIQNQQYYIDNKIIEHDKDIFAEYPKTPSSAYIHTCIYYNLVMINKAGGLTNISYEKLQDPSKAEACGIFRDNVRYLRIALKKALLEERYENAAEIRDKIYRNKIYINNFYNYENDPYTNSTDKTAQDTQHS